MTTDTMDVNKITSKHYEQFHPHQLNNLVKMDQFLERQKRPKFPQEIDNLNRLYLLKKLYM